VVLATSLLADAIAIAAQPLLATCLAQRERTGARKVVRQSLLLGAAAGFATAAALALSGPALSCRLFTKDPAALAAALPRSGRSWWRRSRSTPSPSASTGCSTVAL
jgi:Na+-driven multidrug efflux pump